MKNLTTYNFPSAGLRCYYHTGSVQNAIDIIKHSHLFGSKVSKVNDPDDVRIQWEGVFSEKWIQDVINRSGLLMLKPDVAAARPIVEQIRKFSEKLLDSIYRFVCFADANKTDLSKDSQGKFWKEYAGNFKGARLEFLVDSAFYISPRPEQVLCDNIRYLDAHQAHVNLSELESTEAFCNLINGAFLEELCYTKCANKWSDEFEFRTGSLVKYLLQEYSEVSGRNEHFFRFNSQNLVSVVVGGDASDQEKNDLAKIWGRSLKVATLDNCGDVVYRDFVL